jgi:hypothetical protein
MGICPFIQGLVSSIRGTSMLTGSIPQCKLLAAVLGDFAKKYPMLKILKIPGDQCIEGYPDRLMPTLLVYGPKEYRSQLVGLAELGGNNTKVPGC